MVITTLGFFKSYLVISVHRTTRNNGSMCPSYNVETCSLQLFLIPTLDASGRKIIFKVASSSSLYGNMKTSCPGPNMPGNFQVACNSVGTGPKVTIDSGPIVGAPPTIYMMEANTLDQLGIQHTNIVECSRILSDLNKEGEEFQSIEIILSSP